ncbi:MAG: phosphate ABC transporter substrate-binding protein PstS, partial [Chloroflexota bacterium]
KQYGEMTRMIGLKLKHTLTSVLAAAMVAVAAMPVGAQMITAPFPGEAQNLTGAGATFPAPLYTKWFNDYERVTGVKVNYQAIGSGGGIKAISDKTVDFGATDGPMSTDQMQAAGAEIFHIPTALGAVVATYNVPEVSGSLKFTPDALAAIYLGQITKWNDPILAASNPGLASIDKDIVVVHRSDGSGTSFIFTDYLSSISPTWKGQVGAGNSVNWPAGIGAQGNPGVAGEVKQNPYSIGYVELIYALQNRLGVADILNSSGVFITPNVASVTAAAAGVVDTIAPDLRASIVNASGADAYPISGFTWLLTYRDMSDRAKAIAVTRMMWWAIHEGQSANSELGYAPLPQGIVAKAEEKILAITSEGQTAFPGQ